MLWNPGNSYNWNLMGKQKWRTCDLSLTHLQPELRIQTGDSMLDTVLNSSMNV